MTLEEADTFARHAKKYGTRSFSGEDILRLCDFILSADYKRAIENAAYERAAVQFDRLGCIEAAKMCRALIQPPSAEPIKHEDREG